MIQNIKKSDEGFSAVEVLLVLVVVCLLGGVGYYVFQQNKTAPHNPAATSPTEESNIELPERWKLVTGPTLSMQIEEPSLNGVGEFKLQTVTYTIPDSLIGKLAYIDDFELHRAPGKPGITRIEYLTDPSCKEEWWSSNNYEWWDSNQQIDSYSGPGLGVYIYEGMFSFKGDDTDLDAQYAAGKAKDGNYFLASWGGRMYKIGDYYYPAEYDDGSLMANYPNRTEPRACYDKYKAQLDSDKDLFLQIAHSIH